MTNRLTRWTVIFSLLLSVGLYHVKYRVVALEDKVKQAKQDILSYQESLHLLKAEWVYLTDPKRVQFLAQKHLRFQPLIPHQVISQGDIKLISQEKTTSTARISPASSQPNKDDLDDLLEEAIN